jgi:hypothetical protein
MMSCASCGAEGIAPGQACPRCGAAPELELAVDPPAPVQERAGPDAAISPAVPSGQALASAVPTSVAPAVGDIAFDARLLADYGEAPRHWLFSPLYAWRVFRRRRDLKAALVRRREEAARTAGEVEDALVAFAERVRPVAEKESTYGAALEELHGAEELLRSRDRVLASEQDAQNARLAQVDSRLSKLEGELAQAQGEEQTIAAELVSAQTALEREEAKLKRAETELRAARQREATADGGTGA